MRTLIGPAVFAMIMTTSLNGLANEPTSRELLPDDAVAVLEIHQPVRLAEHPLVVRSLKVLEQSGESQRRLESPEFSQFQQLAGLIEATSGRPWKEALSDLTAGGIVVGLRPGPPPSVTLILTAAAADRLDQFVTTSRELIQSRLTAEGKPDAIKTHEYRGQTGYQIGEAFYTVIGRRFILCNRGEDLKAAVDRLLDGSNQASSFDPAPENLLARGWVNLEAVRQAPDFRDAVEFPYKDAGAATILGGWLDLLRLGDEATAELTLNDETMDLQLRVPVQPDEMPQGMRGFFASAPQERAAPLLNPTGTILSSSWYRDYAHLWRHRSELLTEEQVERLEQADKDLTKQFSVFGVNFSASRLVEQFGPHWRVVAARQREDVYNVELADRTPAAALVVSVRDEERFTKELTPIFRAIGLVVAFGEAKMLSRTTNYRDANLIGFYFRDDPASASKGNRLRFNASPTWTVTRGHFVIGSSTEIVRDVIDELDRQAETEPPASNVTERQRLSFGEVGRGLGDFRETILRGIVFETGLTLDEAAAEFEVFDQFLNVIDQLQTEAGFNENGFEYRVRIGNVK